MHPGAGGRMRCPVGCTRGGIVAMFEKFKARRLQEQAQKAQQDYQRRLTAWQAARDDQAHLIELAKDFTGDTTNDEIVLKPGEALIGSLTNASLVEDRRGPGHYAGSYSGVSIPVGSIGGHSVRYHVGGSRGHYVPGEPAPTAIDTGTVFITDQRVVFAGARQTRECLFSKLVSFHHDPDGTTTFSVSNRQKATVIHYGASAAGWFDFRLDLAVARFRGTVPELVSQLQADEAAIEAAKPAPPQRPTLPGVS